MTLNSATVTTNVNTDRPKLVDTYLQKNVWLAAMMQMSPVEISIANMVWVCFCRWVEDSSGGQQRSQIKHRRFVARGSITLTHKKLFKRTDHKIAEVTNSQICANFERYSRISNLYIAFIWKPIYITNPARNSRPFSILSTFSLDTVICCGIWVANKYNTV